MTSAKTKNTTINPIIMRLGTDIEMTPHVTNLAGPFSEIANATIWILLLDSHELRVAISTSIAVCPISMRISELKYPPGNFFKGYHSETTRMQSDSLLNPCQTP